MVALPRHNFAMSVEEFLDWNPDPSRLVELVDGELRMMAPPSTTHARVQNEVARVIGNHLLAQRSSCECYTTPGVIPRVQAGFNIRIPDLAVSCVPQPANRPDLSEPVLIVEVLSPSNEAKTWSNIWAYTTIPSVQEILVLRTDAVQAGVLRRGEGGSWPGEPESVNSGDLVLNSIGLRTKLLALYRRTPLCPDVG